MKVGEFCTREVVINVPDTTIMQTVKLMRRHHVGDIVVVDAKDHGKINLTLSLSTMCSKSFPNS